MKESPGRRRRAPQHDDRRLTVFGRLATEVTIAAASAEMQTIAERLDEFFPPRFRGRRRRHGSPVARKDHGGDLDDEDSAVRRFGMTLVALVGLVLVVACTNLGNPCSPAERHGCASSPRRRALGASRWRLVREQCLESVMLAAGGAFASYVMFELLRVVMDTEFSLAMPFGGLPRCRFIPR